jgi:hypothetical protein
MFRDEFYHSNRGDNFSYEGLGALYDYLEEVHYGKYDLDVIGLCCEFEEDEIENVLKNYNLTDLDELKQKTIVIYENGENVLFQQF